MEPRVVHGGQPAASVPASVLRREGGREGGREGSKEGRKQTPPPRPPPTPTPFLYCFSSLALYFLRRTNVTSPGSQPPHGRARDGRVCFPFPPLNVILGCQSKPFIITLFSHHISRLSLISPATTIKKQGACAGAVLPPEGVASLLRAFSASYRFGGLSLQSKTTCCPSSVSTIRLPLSRTDSTSRR